jgi:hypothetical protein
MYHLIDEKGYHSGIYYSEFQGDDWLDLTDYEQQVFKFTIDYCIEHKLKMFIIMATYNSCVSLGKIFVSEDGVNLPKSYMLWNTPEHYKNFIFEL